MFEREPHIIDFHKPIIQPNSRQNYRLHLRKHVTYCDSSPISFCTGPLPKINVVSVLKLLVKCRATRHNIVWWGNGGGQRKFSNAFQKHDDTVMCLQCFVPNWSSEMQEYQQLVVGSVGICSSILLSRVGRTHSSPKDKKIGEEYFIAKPLKVVTKEGVNCADCHK